MLKITIHDSAAELTFCLEGRLCGPWVAELRDVWRTGASTTAGRSTVLDLREVDFVDNGGQLLVAEMARAGVRILASSPLIEALVTECVSVEEQRISRPDVLFRSQTAGRKQRAV
jgi:hypothetical protein